MAHICFTASPAEARASLGVPGRRKVEKEQSDDLGCKMISHSIVSYGIV